jgi:hypothetical protein
MYMNPLRLNGHFKAARRFSNKLPSIYLDSLRDADNLHRIEVYLVNGSDEPLDFVASPQPLLYLSTLAQANVEDDILHYEDVQPGEAVRVAEFDEIFDSDFLHQIDVLWQPASGPAKNAVIIDKGIGKFTYHVLEWGSENEG